MESKNPMVRLVVFGRLKRMIQSYKTQKLKAIDKRLLRGLLQNKLRDFDEDHLEKIKNQSLLTRITEFMHDPEPTQ